MEGAWQAGSAFGRQRLQRSCTRDWKHVFPVVVEPRVMSSA